MSSPAAAPDRYIGREILNGQFKILKKIGTGGMGAVYQALQPEMNRMVAVKILHAKLKARKDLVSRFRREARAMSHLSHPNTVKVMMYGELEQGELYIVMEYLEGRNLNQIVRKTGPLPVERAIPVLIQVCGALQEAHELGIIHRDLKPENIFLTNSGGLTDFAKVLDFGLAKVTERELRPGSIMLTQEGMVFGTPEFMSPEQAQGRVLDARSDIYSLAVILYEALTGKLPFEAKTSMEHIQMHVMKPPIPLDERIPGKTFAPGLGAVITRALAKDPMDRYGSATEFADALRPFAPATPALLAANAARAALPATAPAGAVEANANLPVSAAPPATHAVVAGVPPTAAMPAIPQPPSSNSVPVVSTRARSHVATMPMEAVPAPQKSASGTKLLLVAIISVIVGVVATIVVLRLLH